jgi:hypothetical protein
MTITEDYILALKSEATALSITITYNSNEDGVISTNAANDYIYLYRNFDYPTITEEIQKKIAMKKASNDKADKVTWYTDNL